MEVVEISREERDVYLIPQNFVDTGTILGGTVKLRNAVEAAVLAVGSAVPLFYLPLAFNIRLMIVIAVSVPLGVFGVVGIGGDSLTQFVAHWFHFMKRRRIVTPTPQGNLEANRHRHLRFISKRYRIVYYDDTDTLPHNAQVLQRKADRHGMLVKRQTLYDLLPIEKIEDGILHTTDYRYIKILEIEPINFLLRSPREQRSVIYSFASLLKVSPVRLQFKSFSRKADVNAYVDKLRRDAANEPDADVRKRHMSYIRFVKRLGSRDAVSRRFFVIFQYEAPTNERNISYAEIVSTLETTARNFRTYLAQCGNAIVEHENEDEFLTDVFYTLLNRRTAVQVPLQERIQDVLASYLAQNDATALDKIPPAAFMIPPSLDLKHGRYLYMDGTYHAYLMIPADGYRAQVTAGWMALLVNAGEGIDVDLFLERQPKERMMQKIGQQIRINRSKIKDTSDTNSDFDDLSNAIRSGYYLKDGLANNEDFYYAAILVTVTAASVKDLEWRIGEIRKLMVSQDMNLQLCSFRQEAAFLSSLPLCAPDAALFKKYRRNILTSTAASFYPFVSFELCDTNGVLLGVNKYNNSLVSLDNFNTRIANILNRLVHGSASSFNRQTNVNLDNSYVVIDISELSGDLLTVGMYIGLDYMWDKAKEDLTRRKQIFIDEVWQIIGASSNALAANYVFEAVKTIRGYGGGVLVATQDLNDFFSLEDGKYGRGILNNCKIKIILNLEEEEAQRVQSVLKLTDAEIDNITRFERGSALIVTNSNNVTVDMRCSEEEKDLITTDRDELRRIVERKMQNQTETEES